MTGARRLLCVTRAAINRPAAVDTEIEADMTDAVPAGDPRGGGIGAQARTAATASELVAGLYRAHNLALVRTALVLVGDKPTAEDVVQEAFIGLYRAVPRLSAPDKALAYLRASVVNGCRSVHRAQEARLSASAGARPPAAGRLVGGVRGAGPRGEPDRAAGCIAAAETVARGTRPALPARPARRREGVALGVSKATVSSTASRALAALARNLTKDMS
jgi:DNA-directed RNA polymerase specialized sigma24 family protein